jgi:hypothetical protein
MSDNLEKLSEAIRQAQNSYIISGFVVAFFASIIRVLRDDKELKTSRILQESMICGSITVTISVGLMALLSWFDVEPSKIGVVIYYASLFVGGAVGNLGSTYVRSLAKKLTTKTFD